MAVGTSWFDSRPDRFYIDTMERFHEFRDGGWRRPEVLILAMAGAVPFGFATWSALLNNFVIERAAFTGAEIGILQSLREVPGFLAFGVVFVLILMREQTLALASLLLLGIGTICFAPRGHGSRGAKQIVSIIDSHESPVSAC